MRSGALDEAASVSERALAIYKECGLQWGVDKVEGQLYEIKEKMGMHDEVDAWMQQQLENARQLPTETKSTRGDWESTLGVRPALATMAGLTKPWRKLVRESNALRRMFYTYWGREEYQRATDMMQEIAPLQSELDRASISPGDAPEAKDSVTGLFENTFL